MKIFPRSCLCMLGRFIRVMISVGDSERPETKYDFISHSKYNESCRPSMIRFNRTYSIYWIQMVPSVKTTASGCIPMPGVLFWSQMDFWMPTKYGCSMPWDSRSPTFSCNPFRNALSKSRDFQQVCTLWKQWAIAGLWRCNNEILVLVTLIWLLLQEILFSCGQETSNPFLTIS